MQDRAYTHELRRHLFLSLVLRQILANTGEGSPADRAAGIDVATFEYAVEAKGVALSRDVQIDRLMSLDLYMFYYIDRRLDT